MPPTPLKVLLLGWDAPAAATGVASGPAASPELASALAPYTKLALLVPYLPEATSLASAASVTGLGNLPREELARLEAYLNDARSGPGQLPAAPYLGASAAAQATAADASHTSHAAGHDAGRPGGNFVAPAAPYAGSTASSERAGPSALPPAPEAAAPEPGPQSTEAATTLLNPDAFEASAEPEACETEALTPPATDGQFQAGAAMEAEEPRPENEAALPQAAPAPPPRLVAPTVRQSVLDVALESLRTKSADDAGLNFRVIQYARFATRVAASQDFAVIYASDWQSWLAGMEIRQLTGKPLVLHVHTLAQDRDTAADRGWVMELERLALRRADLVLTASSTLALRVLELHGLAPQRVRRLSPATASNPEQLAETILAALREVASEPG